MRQVHNKHMAWNAQIQYQQKLVYMKQIRTAKQGREHDSKRGDGGQT